MHLVPGSGGEGGGMGSMTFFIYGTHNKTIFVAHMVKQRHQPLNPKNFLRTFFLSFHQE